MAATLIFLVVLIVMGSFFSGAFVLFFQKKTAWAIVCLILGLICAYLFFYGLYHDWIPIPEQYKKK